MANVVVRVNASGLLDYAKAGREAVSEVKKATRKVLNIGRTKARQQISAQFVTRTGFLKRQARKMQTSVKVTVGEVSGKVAPLPRLLNIFEHGATIPARTIHVQTAKALKMGNPTAPFFARSASIPSVHLRQRPVIAPAAAAMEQGWMKPFQEIFQKMANR